MVSPDCFDFDMVAKQTIAFALRKVSLHSATMLLKNSLLSLVRTLAHYGLRTYA